MVIQKLVVLTAVVFFTLSVMNNLHIADGKGKCTNITNQMLCIGSRLCPEGSAKPTIFCTWSSGNCCCPNCTLPMLLSNESGSCECPVTQCESYQTFNNNTCQCENSTGSGSADFEINVELLATGKCEEVAFGDCHITQCVDNPQYICKVVNHNCVCPSCDNVPDNDVLACTQTKCVEQEDKPNCVLNVDSGKCECP